MDGDEQVLEEGERQREHTGLTPPGSSVPKFAQMLVRCGMDSSELAGHIEKLLARLCSDLGPTDVITSVAAPNCVPIGKVGGEGQEGLLWFISVGVVYYHGGEESKHKVIPGELQSFLDRAAADGHRVHMEPPASIFNALQRASANVAVGRPQRAVPARAVSQSGLPVVDDDGFKPRTGTVSVPPAGEPMGDPSEYGLEEGKEIFRPSVQTSKAATEASTSEAGKASSSSTSGEQQTSSADSAGHRFPNLSEL